MWESVTYKREPTFLKNIIFLQNALLKSIRGLKFLTEVLNFQCKYHVGDCDTFISVKKIF